MECAEWEMMNLNNFALFDFNSSTAVLRRESVCVCVRECVCVSVCVHNNLPLGYISL